MLNSPCEQPRMSLDHYKVGLKSQDAHGKQRQGKLLFSLFCVKFSYFFPVPFYYIYYAVIQLF